MTKEILSLKNIEKSYQDGQSKRTILNHVDLSVHEGEFVAIVGPSGCGKSTLLNIAGMMLSPDQGEVDLCGNNVTSLPGRKWTKIYLSKSPASALSQGRRTALGASEYQPA